MYNIKPKDPPLGFQQGISFTNPISPHFHTAGGASEASEGHPSMAPKQRTPHTCRNPDLIRGVGKYSRSQMYHKRGLWAIKAKNGGTFPTHAKKPADAPVAAKPPKFYPADDVKKPLVNKRKARPTKLRFRYIKPFVVLLFFSGFHSNFICSMYAFPVT